ncbi:MAG TPA: hypothetical protein VL524_10140, partial [Gemmatimonadaceae bacterium]|nr:hypothetical protein [Gemmatimonadaceae bacterium]
TMPAIEGPGIWAELVDTAERDLRVISSSEIDLAPSSLVLLRYGANRRMTDTDPAVTTDVAHT